MSGYSAVSEPVESPPIDPIEPTLNPLPTIKGKAAVVEFCNERWGVPVKLHQVRQDTNTRRLASHLISKACVYSERDIYCWLKSMRRGRRRDEWRKAF